MMFQTAQTLLPNMMNPQPINEDTIPAGWEIFAGKDVIVCLTNNGECGNARKVVSLVIAIIMRIAVICLSIVIVVAAHYEWLKTILICSIVNIVLIFTRDQLSDMGAKLSFVEQRKLDVQRDEEAARRHNELLALLTTNNVVVNNTTINDAMEKLSKKAADEVAAKIHNQLQASINGVFEGYDIQRAYNTIDHLSDRERMQRQLSIE